MAIWGSQKCNKNPNLRSHPFTKKSTSPQNPLHPRSLTASLPPKKIWWLEDYPASYWKGDFSGVNSLLNFAGGNKIFRDFQIKIDFPYKKSQHPEKSRCETRNPGERASFCTPPKINKLLPQGTAQQARRGSWDA